MLKKQKKVEGRAESFNITVASEIMAILCLAKDVNDLRSRVDNLILAYTYDEKVITVKDLGITGSVLVLLKDAMKPNLVHGGPFANIAHGCNSIIATRLGLKLADYLVTEAGFGADLGAEKFLDIKCREANLNPSAVVLVATIKALKYHGGVDAKECKLPNLEALNRFDTDTLEELEYMDSWAKENSYPLALSEVFSKGGLGGLELAEKVIKICEKENNFNYLYDLNDTVEDKIFKIASKVYGAKEVVYKKKAKEMLEQIKNTNYKDFYICMAKTPLSLTDNAKIVELQKTSQLRLKKLEYQQVRNSWFV